MWKRDVAQQTFTFSKSLSCRTIDADFILPISYNCEDLIFLHMWNVASSLKMRDDKNVRLILSVHFILDKRLLLFHNPLLEVYELFAFYNI